MDGISLNQLKTLIKEAVREVLEESEKLHTQREWYGTNSAYKLLGLDNPEELRVMVRDGRLRVGHEVRDKRSPNSQIPRYQFHLAKCQERLLIPPERRKIKKVA